MSIERRCISFTTACGSGEENFRMLRFAREPHSLKRQMVVLVVSSGARNLSLEWPVFGCGEVVNVDLFCDSIHFSSEFSRRLARRGAHGQGMGCRRACLG